MPSTTVTKQTEEVLDKVLRTIQEEYETLFSGGRRDV